MAKKAKKGAAKKAGPKLVKGAKKSAAKKPARVWESKRGAEKAKTAKSKSAAPKQVPLIKGLRIRALDNCFGHISDTRAGIARLQREEADLEQHGHDLMKKHNQTSWEYAGVAATRIQGEEKIRFTTVRSRGPAPAAQPETEGTPAGAASDATVERAVNELADAIEDAEGDRTDEDQD